MSGSSTDRPVPTAGPHGMVIGMAKKKITITLQDHP